MQLSKHCSVVAVVVLIGQLICTSVQAADNILIGRSLTLSGPLALYGESKRDGGDAYISKINAAGGVGGKRIELITLDDAYVPANMVANIRKIAAENKPVAFLGLFGVPTVAAAIPVLKELQIPGVGLTSGTDLVRNPFNRYVFPVRASYADEARKLVSHAKTIGITVPSIVYMDNPFGVGVNTALIKSFAENSLKFNPIISLFNQSSSAPSRNTFLSTELSNLSKQSISMLFKAERLKKFLLRMVKKSRKEHRSFD